MNNRHGLTKLHSPSGVIAADIIFVHGLFGHPFKTWTARSKSSRSSATSPAVSEESQDRDEGSRPSSMGEITLTDEMDPWPKKLLPRVIPDVRIFTWGYDADVVGFLSSASQNTINQHARNLLRDVDDLRSTSDNQLIPIIFVVHSLGGIIVKDALNLSSSTEGTRLKHIAPATVGVLFLGTPHRGSNSASLGKIASRIALTMRPNLRLLQGLERNSETLERVGDGFSQTVLKHNIRLCCFREELATRKLYVINFMVVNADSAKIGDGREEVGSIPADHSKMTKFESAHDVGFRRVSSQLRRWVEEVKAGSVAKDGHDCLRSLDTAETRTRISDVHKAHEKTFSWIFDPTLVSFSKWLRSERTAENQGYSQIYWIQGKPGSGKSTLMKFAMRDARTCDFLAGDSMHAWKLAAFFFHDRGSNIQKSLTGMMQEILHSILDQCQELLSFIAPIYQKLVQSQRTNLPKWDISALQEALLAIVYQRKVPFQFCLFLDALDEHEGDNEQLASFLKELTQNGGKNVHLKMCLASRSWTVFQQHFGNCPGFAIHEHTGSDIRAYTENRLSLYLHEPQPLIGRDQLMTISTQITDKALGVFIWVRLVVDQLIKDIRDGTSFFVLEDRVTKMPQELRELYSHTLKRIDSEYSAEAYVMFQTALCSFSPLSLYNFMHSASYNLSRDSEFEFSLDLQLRRLESRSGGLLEAAINPAIAKKHPAQQPDSRFYNVQFIHQTVKEYVRDNQHNLGLREVPRYLQLRNGYYFLLNSCGHPSLKTWDHKAISIGGESLRRFLFKYAKAYEESLSKRSEEELEIAIALLDKVSSTIEVTETSSWRDQSWGVSIPDLSMYWFYTEPHWFLKLAIAANLNFYVRKKLTGVPTSGLLHVAAAGPDIVDYKPDHSIMVRTLISQGCPVNDLWKTPFVDQDAPYKNLTLDEDSLVTPLAFLLTKKDLNNRSDETRLQIAKILLEEGADANAVICLHSRSNNLTAYVSLLDYCVRFDSAAFVRLLLQFGAKSADDEPGDMLVYASIRKDNEILQALKDHGETSDFQHQDHPIMFREAIGLVSSGLVAPIGYPFSELLRLSSLMGMQPAIEEKNTES